MKPSDLLVVACVGVVLLVVCAALIYPPAGFGVLGAALVFGAWKVSES